MPRTPFRHPMARSRLTWLAVALLVTQVACNLLPSSAPPTPEPTSEPTPAPIATALPDPTTDDAEYASYVYFNALSHREFGIARNLLTPELQATTSEADLEANMAGVEAIGLAVIIPMSVTPNKIIFQGVVSARTTPDVPSAWNFAANQRYLELIKTPVGWRITKISPDPIEPTP